jgi:hypothetical protein
MASRSLISALCAALALGVMPAATAAALPASGEAGIACGFDLTGPVYQKWVIFDGEAGRLGCPTGREKDADTSSSGVTARQVPFAGKDKLGGAILWHGSGPRAGQAYAIWGCFYRLWAQFGGPSSWLGLPISDPENNPDGQTQLFEGGAIVMQRATTQCLPQRNAERPAVAAAPGENPKAALDLFFDPAREDFLTTATVAGAEAAAAAHYQRVRNEAYVFTLKGPGLSPLKLFWNEARGDNVTVGTPDGERQALDAGYEFGGTQGYVWTQPHEGAAPLKLFWNPQRQDFLTTATAEGAADAAASGYQFVRIEGYAPTSP